MENDNATEKEEISNCDEIVEEKVVDNKVNYMEVNVDDSTRGMLLSIASAMAELEARGNMIARVYLNAKGVNTDAFAMSKDFSKIIFVAEGAV